MSHGAYQHSVLDQRRTAHSLDDSARLGQQFLIGDPDDHVLSRAAVAAQHLFNNYVIFLRRGADDGGQHLGRTGLYLV